MAHNLFRVCLNCNRIFRIRKTGFKWIIKGYWYIQNMIRLRMLYQSYPLIYDYFIQKLVSIHVY